METLLLIAWLSLPLAPLNPIQQDTIAAINLHVAAGVTSPNGIVSTGPELSVKYEMNVGHPFLIRSGLDLRLGSIGTRFFPDGRASEAIFLKGHYQAAIIGADILYYRGTNHLTAYLGLGAVHASYRFRPDSESRDLLLSRYNISDVDISHRFGYRLTLGLRFNRAYCFEIGVTQLEPNFSLGRSYPGGLYSKQQIPTEMSGFRFTLGYIWRIRDW